jgi:integrase
LINVSTLAHFDAVKGGSVHPIAYVGANPVKRVKTSSNRMQRQTSRNFPMEAVHAMLQALELHASTPPDQDVKPARHAQQMHHIARQRWVVALLFGLWGRRAEIASIQMADFRHDGIRWTVQLSRKGGKEQVLPVADWVMKELTRYRSAVGLSPLPSSTEEGPAVGRVRDRKDHTGSVDADTIYRSITATAGLAARALRAHTILADMEPVQRELVATRLEEISPHWFRHSGASIAINSGAMSLENASKMLGHSSTDITAGMYYHPDEGQIADGMEKLAAGAFG